MLPTRRFTLELLHPKHWLSWFALLVWILISLLPYSVQYGMAKLLSPLLRINKKRVHQARVNIRLCFPNLSESEREKLLRENLFSTAMAVFETGIAWFWPKWRLRRLVKVSGLEYIQNAQADGRGVLLLSLHMTTLDVGNAMLGQFVDFSGIYKPHKNPVFDWMQKNRREAYCKNVVMFVREDVRTMVQLLREGKLVYYAPDRNLADKRFVFINFFGVPTATLTATSRFSRIGDAHVIPFVPYRLKKAKGYLIKVLPKLENFPSGDDQQDAQRVNQFMEDAILECPEQYLWAQKRFKTRPDGKTKVY